MTDFISTLYSISQGKPQHDADFYSTMTRAERRAMGAWRVLVSTVPDCSYKLLKKDRSHVWQPQDWTPADAAACMAAETERKYVMSEVPIVGLHEKASAVKALVETSDDKDSVDVTSMDLTLTFSAERQVVFREPYIRRPGFDGVHHFYSTMFAFKTISTLETKVELAQLLGANNPNLSAPNMVIITQVWQQLFFRYIQDIPDRNFKSMYEKFTFTVLTRCTSEEYLFIADLMFTAIKVSRIVDSQATSVRGKNEFTLFKVKDTTTWTKASESFMSNNQGRRARIPTADIVLSAPGRKIDDNIDTKVKSIFDCAKKLASISAMLGGNGSVMSQKIANFNFPFRPSENHRQQLIIWYVTVLVLNAVESTQRIAVFCDEKYVKGVRENIDEEFRDRIYFITDSTTQFGLTSDMKTVFFNFSCHPTLPATKSEIVYLQELEAKFLRYDVYYGPLLSKTTSSGRHLYRFVLNLNMAVISSTLALQPSMDDEENDPEDTWDDIMVFFGKLLVSVPSRVFTFLGWKRYHWAMDYDMDPQDTSNTFAAAALAEFDRHVAEEKEDDRTYDDVDFHKEDVNERPKKSYWEPKEGVKKSSDQQQQQQQQCVSQEQVQQQQQPSSAPQQPQVPQQSQVPAPQEEKKQQQPEQKKQHPERRDQSEQKEKPQVSVKSAKKRQVQVDPEEFDEATDYADDDMGDFFA